MLRHKNIDRVCCIVLALTLLIAFKNMTGFTESFMKLING